MPSIAPIIYGVIGVLALIGALAGLSRGLYRQTVRTVTVILAAVLSFIAIGLLYSAISTELEGKTMTDIINLLIENGILTSDVDTALIENLDMKTAELVLALPLGLVVAPILFLICFILLSAILMILHLIICALCGFKSSRNTATTRLVGFVLGLLQGAAVAGLLLMPFIGIGNMAKESLTVLEDNAGEEEFTKDLSELYHTYAEEFVENPAISVYSTIGINALYESIATVKIDSETEANLTKLAPDAALVATEAIKLRGVDMNNLTASDEAAVDAMLTAIDNNDYFAEILAGLLKSASYAYTNGAIEIGLEDPFASIIDSAANVFHTSSRDNIKGDLNTIVDVIFILSRDGVLSSFSEGSDAILDTLTAKDANGDTTVNKVINVIKSNERIKPLVTVITKISLSVMSEQIGIGEDVTETFENIKQSINTDILTIKKENYETKEEYVAEVSTALDNVLKDNQITIEKEIVDTMAEYVADNYGDIDEITDDEANDIILSYYDAYLEYLETGNIPEGTTPPVLE